MAIINTRSPFFISISDASISYATLQIEIYEGDKDNDYTGTADYVLKKSKIGTDTNITFEVSELVRDFIDMTFDGNYITTDQDHTCKWVRSIITAFDSSDTQLSQTISIDLGLNGYNYFEEGTTNTISSILMTNREVFALADNTYRLPLYTGDNPVVTFVKDGQTIDSYTLSSSVESEEQVAHYSSNGTATYENYKERVDDNSGVIEAESCLDRFFDEFSIGDVDKIIVTDTTGTTEIKVNIIEECKYQPYKITFINKFGVLQDMYFFKKAVVKMDTKRETYKGTTISNGSYSISDHTKRDFNITANETVTLSSGFMNEEYNEVFKQMMLSEKLWITDEEDRVLPINIKTSNLNYKTSLNDKLVEYTFEFSKSYNVINNIR